MKIDDLNHMDFEHRSYPVLKCCSGDFIHELQYEVEQYHRSQYGDEFNFYAFVTRFEHLGDWWLAEVMVKDNAGGYCKYLVNLNLGIIL